MATITERFDSRESTVGTENPGVDLVYTVRDTEDDLAVKQLVEATIPAFYAGLAFQTYRIAHQGGGVWEVTARYGRRETLDTGGSSFSFDTGGGSTRVTQSLQTVRRYAPPGMAAPDFKGAIGVSSDSVEGTDITIPVYHFSETHYVAAAAVTDAYKGVIFALTGKVNDAPFKGLQAGEVLFLGASGSKRGVDDWEITYRFAGSPNRTGLAVGDIAGIEKKGWEYLWVRYADAEDEHVLVKQPIAAYVEKVYEDGDFAALGIGT